MGYALGIAKTELEPPSLGFLPLWVYQGVVPAPTSVADEEAGEIYQCQFQNPWDAMGET